MKSFIQYSDGLRAGRPEFYSRQGQEIFLLFTAPRPELGLTQPPVEWVPEARCLAVKNGGAVPALPLVSSWRGA
jgi:hypothetical protein